MSALQFFHICGQHGLNSSVSTERENHTTRLDGVGLSLIFIYSIFHFGGIQRPLGPKPKDDYLLVCLDDCCAHSWIKIVFVVWNSDNGLWRCLLEVTVSRKTRPSRILSNILRNIFFKPVIQANVPAKCVAQKNRHWPGNVFENSVLKQKKSKDGPPKREIFFSRKIIWQKLRQGLQRTSCTRVPPQFFYPTLMSYQSVVTTGCPQGVLQRCVANRFSRKMFHCDIFLSSSHGRRWFHNMFFRFMWLYLSNFAR